MPSKNSSPKLGEVAGGQRGLLGSVAVWGGWEVRLDLKVVKGVKGIKGSRKVVLGWDEETGDAVVTGETVI